LTAPERKKEKKEKKIQQPRGLSFLCLFFGFQLLGKVWFVFLVVALDFLGALLSVFIANL